MSFQPRVRNLDTTSENECAAILTQAGIAMGLAPAKLYRVLRLAARSKRTLYRNCAVLSETPLRLVDYEDEDE